MIMHTDEFISQKAVSARLICMEFAILMPHLCKLVEGLGFLPEVIKLKDCLWVRQVELLEVVIEACLWASEVWDAYILH